MTNMMVDIHSHILPGLDDGAADWEQALALARAAVAEGITTIIATPHHANGVYHNPAGVVTEAVRELNERLAAEGIPLTVCPGQEIRVHDDLLGAWDRGELLPLGSSNYILLEMPSSRIPSGMEDLLYELRLMGLTAVIAHPERNAEVVRHPERLAALIEAGAISQITSHSLVGGFGRGVEQAAWMLLSRGLGHVIASDAHHPEGRGFRLEEAYERISSTFDPKIKEIFRQNAVKIYDNSTVDSVDARSVNQGVKSRILKFFRHH